MGSPPGVRRLVLLRHAKSAWPHGVPDHERPLAGRGRRNAKATGRWFVTEGPLPELVLCSDAIRARQTWQIVRGALQNPPAERLCPPLYGAGPDEVLELVRQTPESVATLVVVGHEPTMSATTLLLAGAGSDPTALSRVSAKFPTNGIAVLAFTGSWQRVDVGTGVLELFTAPRA